MRVEIIKLFGLAELERVRTLPNVHKAEVLCRDGDDYTVLLIAEKFTKTPYQMAKEAGW